MGSEYEVIIRGGSTIRFIDNTVDNELEFFQLVCNSLKIVEDEDIVPSPDLMSKLFNTQNYIVNDDLLSILNIVYMGFVDKPKEYNLSDVNFANAYDDFTYYLGNEENEYDIMINFGENNNEVITLTTLMSRIIKVEVEDVNAADTETIGSIESFSSGQDYFDSKDDNSFYIEQYGFTINSESIEAGFIKLVYSIGLINLEDIEDYDTKFHIVTKVTHFNACQLNISLNQFFMKNISGLFKYVDNDILNDERLLGDNIVNIVYLHYLELDVNINSRHGICIMYIKDTEPDLSKYVIETNLFGAIVPKLNYPGLPATVVNEPRDFYIEPRYYEKYFKIDELSKTFFAITVDKGTPYTVSMLKSICGLSGMEEFKSILSYHHYKAFITESNFKFAQSILLDISNFLGSDIAIQFYSNLFDYKDIGVLDINNLGVVLKIVTNNTPKLIIMSNLPNGDLLDKSEKVNKILNKDICQVESITLVTMYNDISYLELQDIILANIPNNFEVIATDQNILLSNKFNNKHIYEFGFSPIHIDTEEYKYKYNDFSIFPSSIYSLIRTLLDKRSNLSNISQDINILTSKETYKPIKYEEFLDFVSDNKENIEDTFSPNKPEDSLPTIKAKLLNESKETDLLNRSNIKPFFPFVLPDFEQQESLEETINMITAVGYNPDLDPLFVLINKNIKTLKDHKITLPNKLRIKEVPILAKSGFQFKKTNESKESIYRYLCDKYGSLDEFRNLCSKISITSENSDLVEDKVKYYTNISKTGINLLPVDEVEAEMDSFFKLLMQDGLDKPSNDEYQVYKDVDSAEHKELGWTPIHDNLKRTKLYDFLVFLNKLFSEIRHSYRLLKDNEIVLCNGGNKNFLAICLPSQSLIKQNTQRSIIFLSFTKDNYFDSFKLLFKPMYTTRMNTHDGYKFMSASKFYSLDFSRILHYEELIYKYMSTVVTNHLEMFPVYDKENNKNKIYKLYRDTFFISFSKSAIIQKCLSNYKYIVLGSIGMIGGIKPLLINKFNFTFKNCIETYYYSKILENAEYLIQNKNNLSIHIKKVILVEERGKIKLNESSGGMNFEIPMISFTAVNPDQFLYNLFLVHLIPKSTTLTYHSYQSEVNNKLKLNEIFEKEKDNINCSVEDTLKQNTFRSCGSIMRLGADILLGTLRGKRDDINQNIKRDLNLNSSIIEFTSSKASFIYDDEFRSRINDILLYLDKLGFKTVFELLVHSMKLSETDYTFDTSIKEQFGSNRLFYIQNFIVRLHNWFCESIIKNISREVPEEAISKSGLQKLLNVQNSFIHLINEKSKLPKDDQDECGIYYDNGDCTKWSPSAVTTQYLPIISALYEFIPTEYCKLLEHIMLAFTLKRIRYPKFIMKKFNTYKEIDLLKGKSRGEFVESPSDFLQGIFNNLSSFSFLCCTYLTRLLAKDLYPAISYIPSVHSDDYEKTVLIVLPKEGDTSLYPESHMNYMCKFKAFDRYMMRVFNIKDSDNKSVVTCIKEYLSLFNFSGDFRYPIIKDTVNINLNLSCVSYYLDLFELLSKCMMFVYHGGSLTSCNYLIRTANVIINRYYRTLDKYNLNYPSFAYGGYKDSAFRLISIGPTSYDITLLKKCYSEGNIDFISMFNNVLQNPNTSDYGKLNSLSPLNIGRNKIIKGKKLIDILKKRDLLNVTYSRDEVDQLDKEIFDETDPNIFTLIKPQNHLYNRIYLTKILRSPLVRLSYDTQNPFIRLIRMSISSKGNVLVKQDGVFKELTINEHISMLKATNNKLDLAKMYNMFTKFIPKIEYYDSLYDAVNISEPTHLAEKAPYRLSSRNPFQSKINISSNIDDLLLFMYDKQLFYTDRPNKFVRSFIQDVKEIESIFGKVNTLEVVSQIQCIYKNRQKFLTNIFGPAGFYNKTENIISFNTLPFTHRSITYTSTESWNSDKVKMNSKYNYVLIKLLKNERPDQNELEDFFNLVEATTNNEFSRMYSSDIDVMSILGVYGYYKSDSDRLNSFQYKSTIMGRWYEKPQKSRRDRGKLVYYGDCTLWITYLSYVMKAVYDDTLKSVRYTTNCDSYATIKALYDKCNKELWLKRKMTTCEGVKDYKCYINVGSALEVSLSFVPDIYIKDVEFDKDIVYPSTISSGRSEQSYKVFDIEKCSIMQYDTKICNISTLLEPYDTRYIKSKDISSFLYTYSMANFYIEKTGYLFNIAYTQVRDTFPEGSKTLSNLAVLKPRGKIYSEQSFYDINTDNKDFIKYLYEKTDNNPFRLELYGDDINLGNIKDFLNTMSYILNEAKESKRITLLESLSFEKKINRKYRAYIDAVKVADKEGLEKYLRGDEVIKDGFIYSDSLARFLVNSFVVNEESSELPTNIPDPVQIHGKETIIDTRSKLPISLRNIIEFKPYEHLEKLCNNEIRIGNNKMEQRIILCIFYNILRESKDLRDRYIAKYIYNLCQRCDQVYEDTEIGKKATIMYKNIEMFNKIDHNQIMLLAGEARVFLAIDLKYRLQYLMQVRPYSDMELL
jgi:hypothetical protein